MSSPTANTYRYTLTREFPLFDATGELNWIMLNPSTADATRDDPTIRRCIEFSKRWGYARMIVTNLFAARATNPEALVYRPANDEDPEYRQHRAAMIGPKNDRYIRETAACADAVVVGWGVWGDLFGRDREVLDLLEATRKPVFCLGVTKDGQPRHPLYVSGRTPMVLLKGAVAESQ